MSPPSDPTRTLPRFRHPARRALLAAGLLGLALPAVRADGDAAAAMDRAADSLEQAMGRGWDQCELPEREAVPAAGHWKGIYRVGYDLVSPMITLHMKTEGTLEFDLARHEEPPEPPPAPPSNPLRTPLGSKGAGAGATGTGPGSVSKEDFAKAWDRLNGNLPQDTPVNAEADALAKAIMAEYAGNYEGLHVGPGENGKIQGNATYNLTASLDARIPDTRMTEPMGTKEPLELEVRAEEDAASGQFKELWLWGDPGQINFRANFDITNQGSNSQGQINVQGGNANYHTVTTNSSGRRSEHSGTASGDTSPGKTGLVHLLVSSQDCWLLKGTVDSSQLAKQLKVGRFQVVVTDSEWTATLDERDVDFEQQVQALASEPIPSPLTWDYVERFNQRWQALRKGGKLTDYRLCVLKDLDRKAVQITAAGLRELLRDFPKVRDGDNACGAMTVVNAAMERILPLVRRLQLEGINCPLLDSVTQVVSNEMQKLVKNVLGRKHTFDELSCLAGYSPFRYGLIDYGDQTGPLEDAWTAEAQARIASASAPAR